MQCIAYLPTAPKSRARSLHDAAAQRQQHQGKSDKCCSLRSHNAVDGSAPRHFHQQSLTGLTFMASTGAWHRDWKPSTIPSRRKREREREHMRPEHQQLFPPSDQGSQVEEIRERRACTPSTTQDGFLCTYTAPFYVFMHHLPGKVIGFQGGVLHQGRGCSLHASTTTSTFQGGLYAHAPTFSFFLLPRPPWPPHSPPPFPTLSPSPVLSTPLS